MWALPLRTLLSPCLTHVPALTHLHSTTFLASGFLFNTKDSLWRGSHFNLIRSWPVLMPMWSDIDVLSQPFVSYPDVHDTIWYLAAVASVRRGARDALELSAYIQDTEGKA